MYSPSRQNACPTSARGCRRTTKHTYQRRQFPKLRQPPRSMNGFRCRWTWPKLISTTISLLHNYLRCFSTITLILTIHAPSYYYFITASLPSNAFWLVFVRIFHCIEYFIVIWPPKLIAAFSTWLPHATAILICLIYDVSLHDFIISLMYLLYIWFL